MGSCKYEALFSSFVCSILALDQPNWTNWTILVMAP